MRLAPLLATFVLAGALAAQVPELDDLFDLDQLPEIRLEVGLNAWNDFLSEFDANPRNEVAVAAKFTFERNGNTTALGKVGLRLKGNTSRTRPEGGAGDAHEVGATTYHRAHFALRFDAFDKKARFYGLTGLNLKYFKDDPTYVREVYCLDLFRRFGVEVAPRTSYARVTLRVEGDEPAYLGVYRMLEPIDKVYLERRFPGESDGDLWKCLYTSAGPADLTPGSLARAGLEDPARGVAPSYDLKSPKGDLAAAKNRLVAAVAALPATLEADAFLRALAVSVAVGQWDDYWINANNYYLYVTPSGKLWYLPFDYDNTLGTSQIVRDAGTASAVSWGSVGRDRPLVAAVLGDAAGRARFKAVLAELTAAGSPFEPAASRERVAGWQRLVEPWLANATGEGGELRDAPAAWGNQADYVLGGATPGHRGFFDTRWQVLRREAAR